MDGQILEQFRSTINLQGYWPEQDSAASVMREQIVENVNEH